ncbi:MAG: hypothetical protein LBD27_06110 [Tannerella sp.]|jgi:hypothetical protein|nr:hypothetical protein [Tannerella sp.]
MKRKDFYLKYMLLLIWTAGLFACTSGRNNGNETDFWKEDFFYQSLANRPPLEVAYTDSSRTAFAITAQDYQLVGQLRTPHLLVNRDDAKPWLWFEMEDANGVRYSTQNNPEHTRINLYRRGPYYCEIHWFGVQLTSENRQTAPLKGDLTLFCYPEKILADITWHGVGDFIPRRMEVNGLVSLKHDAFKPFEKGTIQQFSFPVYGETPPLPVSAFKLLVGVNPVRYDKKRGCYILGTHTAGGFQEKFYNAPNDYETATFQITNDRQKRKIYICQESSDGGEITEGGVVLDKNGHPMPVVVQVSKNFAGEKEEKFYNPTDIPFSETFFPLYLEPDESHTLTTLHLFQNWGRHMTKHWSSLGAWMDYFHSSTGVTETTCYVPFKFAGLGGVSIADFRAMSQTCFWKSQPQHDNLAGHSFLSYYDGKDWIHTVYQGTTYRSTGPNWYDIGLHYLSADGKVKTTVNIFETPQSDELRSYFNVTYDVLQPLTIEDARANFRFLNVASIIQTLRFDRFAATGTGEIRLDPTQKPFPVKGIGLPSENFFLAVYGDTTNERGSNAIIVKKFEAGSLKPAATLQSGAYLGVFSADAEADTRLCLVPDADRLDLNAGDKIRIEGYWLPYGATFDTKSAENAVRTDAENAPHITEITVGEKVSDLPVRLKACGNAAQFSIAGGENLIPVIVTGLTEWRYPRIWVRENDRWRPLYHSRNNALDGYQVFCDDDGTFGSVFLVPGSLQMQELKVTVGQEPAMPEKLAMTVVQDAQTGQSNAVQIGSTDVATLQMPASTLPVAVNDAPADLKWSQSVGESLWFTQHFTSWQRGGRLSPNEDDIDLEYWWDNLRENNEHAEPEFSMSLAGSSFDGQPVQALIDGEWKPLTAEWKGAVQAVAVQSTQKDKTLALAFLNTSGAVKKDKGFGLRLRSVDVPLRKRYHVRGKVYLFDFGLDVLKQRILLDLY